MRPVQARAGVLAASRLVTAMSAGMSLRRRMAEKEAHQRSHGNEDKMANKPESHSRVRETALRQMEEDDRKGCSRR
jgi:hypothetical protein